MSVVDESTSNQDPVNENEHILGTAVKWSWLEEKLCASLHTNAKFGGDRAAQRIGLGQGFFSVMARIHPGWVVADERLPRSIVVKIPSVNTSRDIFKKSDGRFSDINMDETISNFETFLRPIHNTEVSLYATIEASDLHLKVPKAYVLQKFDDRCSHGVIVMEDMGEDSFVVPVYNMVSVEEVFQIIDQLVELHKFSFENSNWISSVGTATVASLLQRQDQAKSFMAVVKSLSYLDEKMAPIIDRIIDIWDNIFDAKTLDNLHTAIGIPPVLVHGDLWIGNIIWKQCDGKRTLAAIVDWQMAHPGCAAEDIARIICCALTAKDRREHWRDILRYYYRKLGEKMRKEPPLSFHQLEQSFIRMCPSVMCAISTAFGPVMRSDIEKKYPERVDEFMAVMREKAIGLLEDILYYYALNAEKNA